MIQRIIIVMLIVALIGLIYSVGEMIQLHKQYKDVKRTLKKEEDLDNEKSSQLQS